MEAHVQEHPLAVRGAAEGVPLHRGLAVSSVDPLGTSLRTSRLSRSAKRAGASAVVALACVVGWRGSAVAGVPSAPPESRVPAGKVVGGRQVLAVFPAPPATYEISIPKCSSKKSGTFRGVPRCPFEIRLVQKGKTAAAVQLDEPACGPARSGVRDWMLGADLDAQLWVSGYDRCRVAVGARAVELAPGTTGLLVTQQAGFEHPSRRHWLFVARGRKLDTLWSADEGGAPTTMTTRVLPAGTPHQDDVAFVESFARPLDVTESLTATRLHFDGANAGDPIVKGPLPDARASLFLSWVGPFATADAAYAARGADTCLSPFLVMTDRLFPLLPAAGAERPRGIFLGLVLARREDAAVPVPSTTPCPGKLKPRLIEYSTRK